MKHAHLEETNQVTKALLLPIFSKKLGDLPGIDKGKRIIRVRSVQSYSPPTLVSFTAHAKSICVIGGDTV